MTILPIVIAPDSRLAQVAEPITAIDDSIHKLIEDMFDTLYEAKGAGLAATQVGINKRLFIVDLSSGASRYDLPESEDTKMYVMINPEITYTSEETSIEEEGCLSLPTIKTIPVTRPNILRLKYLDQKGISQELNASGWLARAIQHENDHLNGITLLHHLSRLKRDMALKKLRKYKANKE